LRLPCVTPLSPRTRSVAAYLIRSAIFALVYDHLLSISVRALSRVRVLIPKRDRQINLLSWFGRGEKIEA